MEEILRYTSFPSATFLLLGERGTGKTRAVESVIGQVKGGSVVTVPCGSLSPELAESQIFGHRKGSFTGATEDRKGHVEEAKGGTLFLDEIQDMPRSVQRKLVRFLQDPERRFRPLGDTKERNADVEIVCASHLPMSELRKRLDADFCDRVSLLWTELPPLRDCREDWRLIWENVWREMRRSEEASMDAPWSDELELVFGESGLPGNLRDFQRLALLLMAHDDISVAIKKFRGMQRALGETKERQALLATTSGNWEERVNQLKRGLAEEALLHYGDAATTAEKLGVSAKTLKRHIYQKAD